MITKEILFFKFNFETLWIFFFSDFFFILKTESGRKQPNADGTGSETQKQRFTAQYGRSLRNN